MTRLKSILSCAALTSVNAVASSLKTNCSALLTAANALTLGEGRTEEWVRLAKYGEYGATVHSGGSVRKQTALQVMDKEGAEQLKKQFDSVINQVSHLGIGLPIYEGHPDEPAWAKLNPGVQKKAVGRVKEIQLREDGPYARTVFNSKGISLLSGDAPELSAHSPRFGLAQIPGRDGAYRINSLLSIGLTNDPNLPDTAISLNEEDDPQNNKLIKTRSMDKNTMERLGLNPEASDDSTATVVNTKLDELQSTNTTLNEVKDQLTAANEELKKMKDEKAKEQAAGVIAKINAAVKDGRITEADKPTWKAALEADYDGESKKLAALTKTVVNTKDHTKDVAGRKGESSVCAITSINEAVEAFAKANDLDMSSTADYDKAFAGAKKANEDLFNG